MVYAAFALALVLIWRSTRVVNFAQAPMAMLTTFVALEIIDARPLLLARASPRPWPPGWCSVRPSSGW